MSKGVVTFTESESEFLSESMLGRVATVSPNLEPHVVPVTFEFDGQYIYFSGYNLSESLKFHNLEQNNRVAFVVDDLVSVKPWRPRGMEIRGIARILISESEPYAKNTIELNREPPRKISNTQPYVKIIPYTKRSWGL